MPTTAIQNAKSVSSPALAKFISIARLREFQLPGCADDEHVIGVSGGADSTVLAILLDALFPDTPFHFLFTDTQAEAEGTLESLARLEQFTGRTFDRIAQEDGLYGLIDHYNGFLPAQNQRWCTRILKVEIGEDWMEALRGEREISIHNYSGLRADEPERTGLDSSMPWLKTHFPMRELGMRREDVFAILEETVGVPSFYRGKSRSGCAICPFMRPSEMLATLETTPAAFTRAESVEKLSPRDADRFAISGDDISAQRMAYPIPQFIDIRTAELFDTDIPATPKKRRGQRDMDLFDSQRVDFYMGIEYLANPMMGLFGGSETGTPGVWHSQLVGWSTTRGGLSRKLTTHYYTRLDSCEVFGLKQRQFREEYGLAVFHVELPADQIDLQGSSEGTFSWRRDEPLAKLRQISSAVKKLMMIENDRETIREYAGYEGTATWEAEQYEYSAARLASIDPTETGQLLGTYRFVPGARPHAPAADAMPCFVCSK